jgi:hypothetical protein
LAASGTSAVCCMYPLRVAISPKVSISICPTPGIFVWLCGGMENQGSRYEDSSFRLGPFVFSLTLSVGLFPVLVNGPKDPKPVIRFPATPARNRRRVSKGESRELNNSSRQQYHRIFRSSVRETVSLAKMFADGASHSGGGKLRFILRSATRCAAGRHHRVVHQDNEKTTLRELAF